MRQGIFAREMRIGLPRLIFTGWLEIRPGICNLVTKHVMQNDKPGLASHQLLSESDCFVGRKSQRMVHGIDGFLIQIDEIFNVNDRKHAILLLLGKAG